MNKFLTPSLLFISLFIASCGKNDNTNTTPPVPQPPVNTNPINNTPSGTPLDINALRSVFDSSSLSSNVQVGDYYDQVKNSSWGLSFSLIFFGRHLGSSSSTPDRFKVTSIDPNYVDVEKDGGTSQLITIDRTKLMDSIFSENRTDYALFARRGCIRTAEEGIKEATVVEKYVEFGGGMWSQPQYILQERVVVSTAVPLYLNPISIEKGYQTSYIRRYKTGSRIINIVTVGNCNQI
jgi:hypothetical protein